MSFENGWFLEKNSQWKGQCTGLEVKQVLLEEKTKYQDLIVFESTTWGKVLVLDGVIQLTEKDEMSYQEMLAHIPMFSHLQPEKILIVGGGDGGMLREVCKHECVKSITMVEIDEGVCNASKRFFPSLSSAFGDPRVTLKIQDAVKFVQDCKENSYDVIIVDSSDPVGPAEKLFSPEFYARAHKLLTKDGVMATQGECLWIHQELMQQLVEVNGRPFKSAEYASIQVPTYPCGQICAFVVSKSNESCADPVRVPSPDMDLRYYSARMHSAAFVLPAFVEKALTRK